MATLADINDTLVTQGKTLETVGDGIDSMKTALVGYLKAVKGESLDKLEESREGGGVSRMKAVAGGAITSTRDAAGGLTDKIKGGLGGIGSLLTGGGLAGLGALLGKQLLKRGLPAAILTIFADELADFILGPEADAELRKQLTQAFEFAGFGLLLGRRFAVLGAALGFMMDDEMKATLKELQEEINWDEIGASIRENVKEGLTGITQFVKGLKLFFGEGDFSGLEEWAEGGNVVETLGTLAGLGLLFAPKTLFSFGVGLGKLGLRAGILAISALWNGVPAVLSALGALGSSLLAATPGAAAAGAGIARTAGGMLLSVAGGILRFAGPLGAIIGIATLGYAVGEWFKTTDMYKQLAAEQDKREQESQAFQGALQARIDAGMDPEQAKAEVQALGLGRIDGGFGQRYGQETVREYKGEVVGSQNFMAKLKQLEALERNLGDRFEGTPKAIELAERRAALDALNNSKLENASTGYVDAIRKMVPNVVIDDQIINQAKTPSTSSTTSPVVAGNNINSGNTSVQSSQAITMPPANVNNTIDTSDLMLVSP